MTTPSGLSIGIILTIVLSKNYLTWGLLDANSLINPLHIYDALVYPGCILQLINITFLWPFDAKLLKVMIGIASPIKLYVNVSIFTF